MYSTFEDASIHISSDLLTPSIKKDPTFHSGPDDSPLGQAYTMDVAWPYTHVPNVPPLSQKCGDYQTQSWVGKRTWAANIFDNIDWWNNWGKLRFKILRRVPRGNKHWDDFVFKIQARRKMKMKWPILDSKWRISTKSESLHACLKVIMSQIRNLCSKWILS